MKELLTVNQVAGILKIHPVHLRRLVSNKRIKFYKVPGVGIRFDSQDIQRMIEEGEVKPVDWDKKVQEWRS